MRFTKYDIEWPNGVMPENAEEIILAILATIRIDWSAEKPEGNYSVFALMTFDTPDGKAVQVRDRWWPEPTLGELMTQMKDLERLKDPRIEYLYPGRIGLTVAPVTKSDGECARVYIGGPDYYSYNEESAETTPSRSESCDVPQQMKKAENREHKK